MTEQVPGQVGLDDAYADWREVPAMGEMAEDELRASEVSEFATKVPERQVEPELPPDVATEERALVTVAPQPRADHHIVTGMAALARMSDEEYETAITVVQRGLARVKDFMQRAMIDKEDYGKVRGIERPFLHLPGAEKLSLLYGLAVRQEADRIVGQRELVITPDGSSVRTDKWESAPLAYHVKSYVHVGDFDGPIVAMGYGEANSWEVKYRYTWAKAKCPGCQREGLIRGKPDGKLKGKWWCPSREGGCNRTFEPNDPAITPPGKVENDDPHSLAETLIQMAAKRSFVAAIRRATGTSGLFTQDEDSPSVIAQSEGAPETAGDDDVKVTPVTGVEVARGGKAEKVTPPMIARLSKISKEKDLGPSGISHVIAMLGHEVPVFEGTRGQQGKALIAWISEHLTADQMGQLLHTLETGEKPMSDELAEALYPEDTGAK